MPARFVEITTLADEMLKSDAFSYVPSMAWQAGGWQAGLWDANATSGSLLERALSAAGHTPPPSSASQSFMLAAGVVLVARAIVVRVMTRTSLAEFGHAHMD